MWLGFGCMHQVGKFHCILYKEYGDVVSYQIPVAFGGIKLAGETTHITCSIRRPALPDHRGKTHENRGAFPCFSKQGSARILGERFVTFEISMCRRAARVDYAFRYALMIE